MINKILILVVGLALLNGCVGIGFEKGLYYEKKSGYRYNYDFQSRSLTVDNGGNEVFLTVYKNECGEYALFGPLIPFIPIWQNHDCKEVKIGVSRAKSVYLKYHNQIYHPSNVSKSKTYTFPILVKSISDVAILVVEKDGEKFEIPFRYQHTFQFDLWPSR